MRATDWAGPRRGWHREHRFVLLFLADNRNSLRATEPEGEMTRLFLAAEPIEVSSLSLSVLDPFSALVTLISNTFESCAFPS